MNVLLLISVFDVKEQESTGHYHSKDCEGREDAVERQGDFAQLLLYNGFVFRRLKS